MPTYQVTDPQTGRKVRLTGEQPPTEAQLQEIFASLSQGSANNEPSLPQGDTSDAILEPLKAITAGVAGTIGGGVAGLYEAVSTGDAEKGGEAVNSITDEIQEEYAPKTQAGQQGLEKVGGAFKMLSDIALHFPSKLAGALKLVESGDAEQAKKFAEEFQASPGKALGNEAFEATGSPVAATIAESFPTLIAEIAGFKGVRIPGKAKPALSSNVDKAIKQAVPDLEAIRNKVTSTYNELDSLGVKVKSEIFDGFADSLINKLMKEGVDPDLTPKANALVRTLDEAKGTAKTATDLDQLRKKAQIAASSIDKPDARLGTLVIKELDQAIDGLATEIGGKFKQARDLHRRASKSQSILDMIENAESTASGLENGLRIEARKILKNRKKRRGFKEDEIKALKQIEQGTTMSNITKWLGKFGISEGQATSMLGASIGIGGGSALGSFFGPAGAAAGGIAIPALGQLAKKTAQKLTLNSTKYADELVRAGPNARSIVRTYLKHTPASKRSVKDLTELLLNPDVDVKLIKSLPSSSPKTKKLVADAKFLAEKIKDKAVKAGSAGLMASGLAQD